MTEKDKKELSAVSDQQPKTDSKQPKAISIRIRAFKTRIFNPKTNKTETYYRNDVIKKPWPELLKLAEKDKKHNTLIIIEADSK